MQISRQQKAYLYAGCAVLLWSTVATAFKLSLAHMSPLQLLLWADIASILCLGGILAATGRFRLFRGYTAGDLAGAAALGILNPFLYYVVLFFAYDLLPAQEAQPLNYTWAITLTILSIPLLGHKVSGRELAGILVSYFGVVIISTHGRPFSLEFSNLGGVALALGSTVIWALYWIYNTRSKIDPVCALFLNFAVALPFIFLACMIFSDIRPPSVPGLAGAVYVGFFEMGIAFVLWLQALRHTRSAAKISSLIFFSPFLSLVFIHHIAKEPILASTVAGLVFIVAGNALQKTGRKAASDSC